jgi:hypothetical protein
MMEDPPGLVEANLRSPRFAECQVMSQRLLDVSFCIANRNAPLTNISLLSSFLFSDDNEADELFYTYVSFGGRKRLDISHQTYGGDLCPEESALKLKQNSMLLETII